MEIQFLGAAREVGRSAVLLDTGETKVVLDYGVKLGGEENVLPIRPLPVHGFLDSVILSHAHLDHSGAVPFLFSYGEPTVFTHVATSPIAELLIEDSMNIARNKKQRTFTRSQLKRMMRNLKKVPYGQWCEAAPGISFKFSDAGHILGASITTIRAEERTIVYSGDFKDESTRLHKAARLPKEADVLIVEATYGNKEHPKRSELEKEFLEEVKAVVESGGSVVLPCFAVGRSQEIVELLYSAKLSCPVYLDGMARDVSEIYLEFPDLLRDYDELYNALKWANWITHGRDAFWRASL